MVLSKFFDFHFFLRYNEILTFLTSSCEIWTLGPPGPTPSGGPNFQRRSKMLIFHSTRAKNENQRILREVSGLPPLFKFPKENSKKSIFRYTVAKNENQRISSEPSRLALKFFDFHFVRRYNEILTFFTFSLELRKWGQAQTSSPKFVEFHFCPWYNEILTFCYLLL